MSTGPNAWVIYFMSMPIPGTAQETAVLLLFLFFLMHAQKADGFESRTRRKSF